MPDPLRFPESVPELSDGWVRLRSHGAQDISAIVAQCNDPESTRWTTVPRPYGPADAQAFLQIIEGDWNCDGTRYWAIEWTPEDEDGNPDPGGPRFAGTIDLRPTGANAASLGFGLHPAARGDGVMSSAVRLVCSYAFGGGLGIPIDRVHWSAVAGNFASRRVAWACGFEFHGTIPLMPGPLYDDGAGGKVLRDHWVASLARGEEMIPSTPWLSEPTIEGEAVRLRPWREDDAEHAEALVAPGHHMPSGAAPDDLTFEAWLLERRLRAAKGEGYFWCVADRESDRPRGAVMIFERAQPVREPGAELGYFLFPSARGMGLATEAADLAASCAFAPTNRGGLGLSRLSAVTAADNMASNGVLERVGFVRWGIEHETDRLPDGSTSDAYHWELLASQR